MTFSKSHQKLHIWLLADLVLLAAFWIAREHRDWMNALERFVSAPIRRSLGSLCYRVSFSVMEALYVLAAVLVLAYVVWNITAVVRARGRRKRPAYSAVLGAVCAGLSVCAATCLLWGVCYYTDTFQDRSGIRAEEVSLPELTAVTAWFAENLAQTADQVPRDEAGTFNASLNEIFAGSTDIYQGAEDLFPFLEFEDRAPKRMFFSRVMSAMNFTGVYFAFTGESNINVDARLPDSLHHRPRAVPPAGHRLGAGVQLPGGAGLHHQRRSGVRILRLADGVHPPGQRPVPGGSGGLAGHPGQPSGHGAGGSGI